MRRLRETTAASRLLERLEERIELHRFGLPPTCGSFDSVCTCWLLWNIVGWASAVQAGFIVTVSVLGENHVSGLGYYRYSEANCCLINRVPIWIPFMWITVIQGTLPVISSYQTFNWMKILTSGIMCTLIELSFVVPCLCRRRMLWSWSQVETVAMFALVDKFILFCTPFVDKSIQFVYLL